MAKKGRGEEKRVNKERDQFMKKWDLIKIKLEQHRKGPIKSSPIKDQKKFMREG